MDTLEALIHLKSICDKEEDCSKCEIKRQLHECVYQTIPGEWKLVDKKER